MRRTSRCRPATRLPDWPNLSVACASAWSRPSRCSRLDSLRASADVKRPSWIPHVCAFLAQTWDSGGNQLFPVTGKLDARKVLLLGKTCVFQEASPFRAVLHMLRQQFVETLHAVGSASGLLR